MLTVRRAQPQSFVWSRDLRNRFGNLESLQKRSGRRPFVLSSSASTVSAPTLSLPIRNFTLVVDSKSADLAGENHSPCDPQIEVDNVAHQYFYKVALLYGSLTDNLKKVR
jgi:hypothetical protein